MTTMTSPPAPVLSDSDLLRLADQGLEYAGGQIVEKMMGIESARVELRVGRLLSESADASGHSVAFSQSVNYRCYADEPAKYRKPDISVVRAERLKGVNPDSGFLSFPADLVVEVLSPNDFAIEVAEKVEEYLANGFPLVWIVNPSARTVTIHRADGSVALLHETDEITGETALPAFRHKVMEFFAKPA